MPDRNQRYRDRFPAKRLRIERSAVSVVELPETFPEDFLTEVAKGNIVGHSIVSKYGANHAVPNASFELVSTLSAAYAGFLAAATTVRIKAGGDAEDDAAGDGARSVFVEGINDSLARDSEEIVTNGVDVSSSTTKSFWRIDRAYVGDAGVYATPYNTADIVIENTAGTADLIMIEAEEGQSQHAYSAIPTGVDAYLLGYEITIDSAQAADFRFCTRANLDDVAAPVSPRRIKRHWQGLLEPVLREFEAPVFLVSGPAEVWFDAAGGGGATEVTATFELLLAPTP